MGVFYRSAQLSGKDLKRVIKEKGIKTIINLRGRWKGEEWYETEKNIARENDVKLYDIEISPHDLPDFDKLMSILNILLNGEKPLLIHCKMGVDRTGFVSALALLMGKTPQLSVVKEQFSFKYWVLPFYSYVGPHFFEQYEDWMKKKKKSHSRDNFFFWAENEYVDSHGNLKFWIDTVNGSVFNDYKVLIRNSPEELSVKGWAFDLRTKSPSDSILYVFFDNQVSQKAFFQRNMPGIARHFKLDNVNYSDFMVGWEAVFKKSSFTEGCHKINLKLVSNESGVWHIGTDFELCLN
ncbi:MAG: tyrosine-protein phosphatase [Candidatus Mariimomonas ferrooxydans]